MKVCFFSKYPPIEGGTSSRTYWFTKGLGKAGCETHIVTNALEVENAYREQLDFENLEDLEAYQPKNVHVHSLEYGAPSHIPYSQEYLARMINLGLNVMKDYDCDVIDSYYFLPYGLAAMFLKMLTGKPLIIRHAGSDIARLFNDKSFHSLFLELFRSADFIITDAEAKNNIFRQYEIEENKIITHCGFGIDFREFNSNVDAADLKKDYNISISERAKILTYIGKYGQFKGVDELIESLSEIQEDFFLLLIIGKAEKEVLEEKISKNNSLRGKYLILDFVPPWRIPGIIKRSDLIIQLENNFPIVIHDPIQPFESLAVGTPVLLSNELFKKHEKFYLSLGEGSVYFADPQNKTELRDKILEIMKKSQRKAGNGHEPIRIANKSDFENAIKNNIEIYKFCCRNEFKLNMLCEETRKSFRKSWLLLK